MQIMKLQKFKLENKVEELKRSRKKNIILFFYKDLFRNLPGFSKNPITSNFKTLKNYFSVISINPPVKAWTK